MTDAQVNALITVVYFLIVVFAVAVIGGERGFITWNTDTKAGRFMARHFPKR